MAQIKVGVLRGGPSREYDISLKTGSSVLNNLPEEKYTPHDIFISKDGRWHKRGVVLSSEQALGQIDVVFNALHGPYGEDGQIQRLLNRFSVPYTGSGAFASAVGMNKVTAREMLTDLGIHMPHTTVLEQTNDPGQRLFEIFRTTPLPLVVKPLSGGSSLGVHIVSDYNSLFNAVEDAFSYGPKVLLEEYIRGKEATCGVIEHFREKDLYALLPIEIIPPKETSFFDHMAKYNGQSIERCPGNFTKKERDMLQDLATLIHNKLGLRHYSRSDFIISPNGIFFLETNTLPGLTPESLFPKSLNAVGSTLPEFLDHVITLALENHRV